MVEDGFDEGGGFGPDAEFEVAFVVALGAEAGAGEVGGAEVHGAGVEDDGLGVEAWAAADGEVGGECGAEFAEGGGGGGAGVEEADFNVAFGEASEDLDDGFGGRFAAGFSGEGNEHGFEVGGEDVDGGFGAGDAVLDDFSEVLFVGDEFALAEGEGGEDFEFVLGGHGWIIGWVGSGG